jgi:hypothetical protein
MKIQHLIVSLFLLGFTCNSWALLPPKYLSVPHWKSCVSTEMRKTAEFYCLPHQRPRACPHQSWKELTHQHLMNYCVR